MFWMIVIAAGCLSSPLAELPPSLDLGDELVFQGSMNFLKPETGELYRQGLLELRSRRFGDAGKTFRKARTALKEKPEIQVFDRLVREADAGVELVRIQGIADGKGLSSGKSLPPGKGGEAKALAEVQKAIPRMKGLALQKEFRRLEELLRGILFYILDDFETEGTEGSGNTAAEKKDDVGKKKQGSLARSGAIGKALEARTAGGEVQSIRGGADKVRQGENSYRWPVGKEQKLKIFEMEPGILKDHSFLDFSIRGTAGKTAAVQVLLLHDNIDWMQFALGKFRGYTGSVTVTGAAWKDYRLAFEKDFVPKDEPEKDRIIYCILAVKNQADQVLYLDDVRLEK